MGFPRPPGALQPSTRESPGVFATRQPTCHPVVRQVLEVLVDIEPHFLSVPQILEPLGTSGAKVVGYWALGYRLHGIYVAIPTPLERPDGGP